MSLQAQGAAAGGGGGSARRSRRRAGRGAKREFSVLAGSDMRVYDFMMAIMVETDIAPAEQRLFFQGKPLPPDQTLSEAGVKASDRVYMQAVQEVDVQEIFDDISANVGAGDHVRVLQHGGGGSGAEPGWR